MKSDERPWRPRCTSAQILVSRLNPSRDLLQPVDTLIVIGTKLYIPSLRRFAEQICRKALRSRDGVTVWLNKQDRRPNQFRSLLKYEVLGDCDAFASLVAGNM